MNQDQKFSMQRLIGVVLIVGGLWHVAAPWIFGYSNIMRAVLSDVISGAALALVGVGYVVLQGGAWLNWIGGAIGVWVLIAPQILGVGRPALAMLEASWGGPITLVLVTIAALDRWFERSPGVGTETRPVGA